MRWAAPWRSGQGEARGQGLCTDSCLCLSRSWRSEAETWLWVSGTGCTACYPEPRSGWMLFQVQESPASDFPVCGSSFVLLHHLPDHPYPVSTSALWTDALASSGELVMLEPSLILCPTYSYSELCWPCSTSTQNVPLWEQCPHAFLPR